MIKRLRAMAMAFAALPFAACAGGDGPRAVYVRPPEPDVMGQEWDLAKGADVYAVGTCGRLFKNGVTYSLKDPRVRAGNSVFVSGENVYVACETRPEPPANESCALLWKNGEVSRLGEESGWSTPYSVLVSNGDVYVAGEQGHRAALWVNGELRPLSDGRHFAKARSLFVSGRDVYAGGQDYDDGVVWKNGAPQELRAYPGPGRYTIIYSVFVSGGDVYAAGMDWTGECRAVLFKNGEGQVLEGYYADALSVVVSGGDVYVVGNETHRTTGAAIPILWKNGEKQRLTDGGRFARVRTLAVSGGDVYVGGYIDDEDDNNKVVPTLWINGEAVDIRPSGFTGMVRSVFVVPKGGQDQGAAKGRPAQ